jgi:putative ABC transport system ATP-binding protein
VAIPKQIDRAERETTENPLTPIVEAVDLKKTHMLGKVPVAALRGVKLRVDSGDFLAVLGPYGGGKSSLLNLIGALDKPTDGKMLIEGADVLTLNESQLADLRRRIGFVFQFSNLIPSSRQERTLNCRWL